MPEKLPTIFEIVKRIKTAVTWQALESDAADIYKVAVFQRSI